MKKEIEVCDICEKEEYEWHVRVFGNNRDSKYKNKDKWFLVCDDCLRSEFFSARYYLRILSIHELSEESKAKLNKEV